MDRFGTMEAFVRVVETGSFSEAARQLRIGQPGVSKAIAQLEERLGVKLLVRNSRGLAPTEQGQEFFRHAKRSIDEAHEADLSARASGNGLSGRLRVSAPVTFARLQLVPHLGEFLDQNPDLELDFVLDDQNVDLLEAGIDVALRMGQQADSTLTTRRIAESPRLVVGTRAYFDRCGIPTSPAALIERQAIIYDQPPGGTTWEFHSDNVSETVTTRGRFRVTAAEGLRAAVLAHLGFAVASGWLFEAEQERGEVITVLDEWTLPAVSLWAVFPTGRQP
ncbi:MAG TPA: LysR family transcriptional regulator, partial [Kofleriaceae bacterium]|nr:LysR family transcriptional regulator [Kofleriaceae bacterium]